MSSTDSGRWLPLAEAARVFGLRPETLRKQVKRGKRTGRLDNHGRWEVHLTDDPSSSILDDAEQHGTAPMLDVSALREQVARLEERLAAAEEIKAELRRQVQELRERLADEDERREAAERRQAEDDRRFDEVLRQLGELRDERQRRRPWPGLIAWARRIVYGDDRGTGGAT